MANKKIFRGDFVEAVDQLIDACQTRSPAPQNVQQAYGRELVPYFDESTDSAPLSWESLDSRTKKSSQFPSPKKSKVSKNNSSQVSRENSPPLCRVAESRQIAANSTRYAADICVPKLNSPPRCPGFLVQAPKPDELPTPFSLLKIANRVMCQNNFSHMSCPAVLVNA